MALRLTRNGKMLLSGGIEGTGVSMVTGLTGSVTPPTVSSYSPIDGATDVEVDANLVITFDMTITVGSGNILIKKTSDDSTIQTIDVTSGQVVIDGAVATINPANLDGETGYYVTIADGVFENLNGINWAGISVKTVWNFTTVDVAAPTVESFSPADDALGIVIDTNLVITFNENVQKGTGNIVIKKTFDDSTIETIDVTSGLVTMDGTQVIINPSSDLVAGNGYYIQIANGAIKDLSNNNYVGISDTTTWSFRTIFGDAATRIGSLPIGVKWAGGVLAANGCIYGMPLTATDILKIDPSDETISTFGGVLAGGSKWNGGVFVPANGCIYGIPYASATILKIDTSDDSVTTFGALGAGDKWAGGVLAANGCIYCMPYDSATILKIDTSDDSTSLIGSLGAGGDKWTDGVLAANGCIYGCPRTATTVLKIDPSDDSVSTFGSLTGTNKWTGCALAANGCMYGIPLNATDVLKVDTATDTPTRFGSLSGATKWIGGVLVSSNGCIYGMPYDSVTVLKIDPSSDTLSTFGNLTIGSANWVGGVLALTNVIYGIPRSSQTVLRIG